MIPASRNRTYAEGVPIHPGDLNDIMDAIIQGAHGPRPRNYPGTSFIPITDNGAAPGVGTISTDIVFPLNGYSGAVQTGAAVDLHLPMPFDVGDRLLSITLLIRGDGAVDISAFDVGYVDSAGAEHSLGNTLLANVPNVMTNLTIDLTDHALAAGEVLFSELIVAGSGLKLFAAYVTYDHPLA